MPSLVGSEMCIRDSCSTASSSLEPGWSGCACSHQRHPPPHQIQWYSIAKFSYIAELSNGLMELGTQQQEAASTLELLHARNPKLQGGTGQLRVFGTKRTRVPVPLHWVRRRLSAWAAARAAASGKGRGSRRPSNNSAINETIAYHRILRGVITVSFHSLFRRPHVQPLQAGHQAPGGRWTSRR